MTAPPGPAPREAVAAVWRLESARIVGALVRMTHDLALAEDLAGEAVVAALEQWPTDGIPGNPGAWLMAVAKRRAVDHFRRAAVLRDRIERLGSDLKEVDVPDLTDAVNRIEDDVLRLIFLTCSPALTPESRAALTLRLVGGLTTDEIARAFLVPSATMGQRLSRAKRTLAEAGIDDELPAGTARTNRLDDVLAVVYLIFTEGYVATGGDEWARPDLCHEGVRLARLLAALAPDEPAVHGLQALLELQASRLPARTASDGTAILLEDQDRARWDGLLIRRGLAALARAEAAPPPVSVYTVQAAIAACHARARTAEATDWARIADLYDVLGRGSANPVVHVNRAVAHGRAHGPAAGLRVLDEVAMDPSLAASVELPAVRADLLHRAGRHAEAQLLFEQAARLTRNGREAEVLLRRARECSAGA